MKGNLAMEIWEDRIYTVEDINELPEGVRAELMDGKLYFMATPTTTHQCLVPEICRQIRNHIDDKNGVCKVLASPAVFLYSDNSVYVEPDIVVQCDLDKLEKKGIIGAPDWIIEVTSPSSVNMDYNKKLVRYRAAGVKEYWLVNPMDQTIIVYYFEQNIMETYDFTCEVPVRILEDLVLDFKKISEAVVFF